MHLILSMLLASCAHIKNADARHFCEHECGLIQKDDLRNYCLAECGLIQDDDMREQCEAANRRHYDTEEE
jgi:hypothetical protein